MSTRTTHDTAAGAAHGRAPRRVVVALVAACVVAAGVVVAVLTIPASHSSASTQPRPRHSSADAVFTVLPALSPPPPDPHPLSPGLLAGSDQYESDPFLYRSHGHYYLYTSDIPGWPRDERAGGDGHRLRLLDLVEGRPPRAPGLGRVPASPGPPTSTSSVRPTCSTSPPW